MNEARNIQLWLDNLSLHDASVGAVVADYNEYRVSICLEQVRMGRPIQMKLVFQGVICADISFYEPWGAGTYVSEVTADPECPAAARLDGPELAKRECLQFRILLNSGDTINIVASRVECLSM